MILDTNILQLGYIAFITFGLVWFVGLFYKTMTSKTKFILSVAIAVALSFVPVELGNEIATRVKDGIGVASMIAGLFQFSTRVAEKV